MMKFRVATLFSVIALALLTAGCLDDPVEPKPTGPEPLDPLFLAAVSANGDSLPAFINADGAAEAGRQLTKSSLMILENGSLRLTISTRNMSESGEPEAAVADTLWARIQTQGTDSVFSLSQLEDYPLSMEEDGHFKSNGDIVITVKQPLPPSGGVVGTYPVKLLFQLAPSPNN